ncbi:MAG: hypothetical protein HBSAPP03_11670 [Phycisphaerae bacterium]|nr:MAG: hypothetical protein HBSAPP03_11670 [Phycisphaerae bacterium]
MTDPAHHGFTVRVLRETATERGWRYVVEISRESGETTTHTMTLGWRDHDYWCGGAAAPSLVVQRILEYVLAHRWEALPSEFDAARARRWLPRIDEDLRHAA